MMVNFNLSQLRVHGLEVTSDDDTIPVYVSGCVFLIDSLVKSICVTSVAQDLMLLAFN